MAVTSFTGLATGIDSASLIDALIKAKEGVNDIRRSDIDFLATQKTALEEFNTKLLALNDAVDKFRTINAGGVSKKTSSSVSDTATATATSAAQSGAYTLTVTSLAAAGNASFNDTYSSSSQAFAPNAVGTQVIGVDIGTGSNKKSININVTSSTTAKQYVDAFNADSNASGRASASLVNVGTDSAPSYKVMITSLESGTEKGTIAFNIASGVAGFGGNSDLQTRSSNPATDAEFSISGISGTVKRASNTVSDLIGGVTFDLAGSGTTSISISNDSDATYTQFKAVVDAYNDLVEYSNENNLVERKESGTAVTNTYGTLAKTKIDEQFFNEFRMMFSAATTSQGTSVKTMSAMGVSTNRDGTLTLDETAFKEAVTKDPRGAEGVITDFADNAAGVNGFIYSYTKLDGFIDKEIAAGDTRTENLNEQISTLERYTAKMRESLQKQFTNLESIVGKMQSSQQALTAVLAAM